MAQRIKSKASKGRTRDRAPRRVASRVNRGRKRASGRRSRTGILPPEYDSRHGVKLIMPQPERWRFKEEANNETDLRFYFERLPPDRKAPLRVLYRSTRGGSYLGLREFAEDILGQNIFMDQPGTDGRFRGMPALIVDQNASMCKFGYTRDVRVHERNIFFRNGDRWCYFCLLSAPNDFSRRLVELDEVLKGILVN